MGLIVPATFPEPEPSRVPGLINVIRLVRVSGVRQDYERQIDDTNEVASEQGLHILKTIELAGISGTSMPSNEEMLWILEQITHPHVAGLLISEVSRAGRPQKGSDFRIIDNFQKFGKKIFTHANGNFDISTDEGFFSFITALANAGKELRDIRRRSMSGKLKNAKKGKLNSGSIPFGYQLVKRDRSDMSSTSYGKRAYMIIHEINAALVRRIYNMALARIGVNEIARRLNEEGIHSAKFGQVLRKDPKTGEPTLICDGLWSERVVYQILTNEAYTGSYWYHKGKPDAVRIPCPVIIERSVWEHVQLLLPANKKTNTGLRHGQSREYLLTGFGYCLICGERLSTKPRPQGRAYYVCGHRKNKPPRRKLCVNRRNIDKELLETTLWDGLWARLSDPDTLCALISDAYQDAPVDPLHEASIAELRSELKRLQAVEKRMRENMDDPDLDRDETKRKFEHARKSREHKEFALRQAEAKIVCKSAQKPANESIRALAAEIAANEPKGHKERRAVIEVALKRFWTDGNVIDIEVAIPGDRFGGPIRDSHTPGEEKARRSSDSGIYSHQNYAHPLTSPISFKFSLNLR